MDAQSDARFTTAKLPDDHDYLAPDGSQIRLLPEMPGEGLAHCRLPAHHTSTAVTHKTVEEIWYFLGGRGEIWRRQGGLGRDGRGASRYKRWSYPGLVGQLHHSW